MISYKKEDISKVKPRTGQLLLMSKFSKDLGFELEGVDIDPVNKYFHYIIKRSLTTEELLEEMITELCFKHMPVADKDDILSPLFSAAVYKHKKAGIYIHVVPDEIYDIRKEAAKILSSIEPFLKHATNNDELLGLSKMIENYTISTRDKLYSYYK
jgi:hypothetical protein